MAQNIWIENWANSHGLQVRAKNQYGGGESSLTLEGDDALHLAHKLLEWYTAKNRHGVGRGVVYNSQMIDEETENDNVKVHLYQNYDLTYTVEVTDKHEDNWWIADEGIKDYYLALNVVMKELKRGEN